MTQNQKPEQRGGKREGAGRAPDYRKRCEICAIQLALGCSDTTARRTLREWNGNFAGIVGSHKYGEVVLKWDEMDEFEKGITYGALGVHVHHMLKRGIGRRE